MLLKLFMLLSLNTPDFYFKLVFLREKHILLINVALSNDTFLLCFFRSYPMPMILLATPLYIEPLT